MVQYTNATVDGAGSTGHPPKLRTGYAKVHKENWDDLRFVLAVAETGSVSAAARSLAVNHATVLRRVSAFESAHGGAVLQRGPAGYEVLPERLPVIEAARLAAAALDQVAGLMRGDAGPERPVRVTSTDSICTTLLPRVLARLMADPRMPRMDLRCSNAHRNLGRLEADITVRPTIALPADLVGVPAGELAFGVYHARGAAPPEGAWLGVGGPLAGSVAGTWFARTDASRKPLMTADSFLALAELAAQGGARTVLPEILGDRDTRLVRDPAHGIVAATPLWVASHVELAEAPRLARLRRELAQGILAVSAAAPGRDDA